MTTAAEAFVSEPFPPISDFFLHAESGVPIHFVREHLRQVYALIYQLVDNAEVAQDLTQETLIRALQRGPNPRQLDKIGRELPALAASAALEYLRRTQVPQAKTKAAVTFLPETWPPSSCSQREALKALTTLERVALLLHDTEQIPLSAVARRMECSVGTARIHLARARVKIAQVLRSKRTV